MAEWADSRTINYECGCVLYAVFDYGVASNNPYWQGRFIEWCNEHSPEE